MRADSPDQQLCRWLLLSLARLQAPEVVMTQELIANMLGVRREGATEAAANLPRCTHRSRWNVRGRSTAPRTHWPGRTIARTG
jgi:hypothetical protein